jgi:hypothetical protein
MRINPDARMFNVVGYVLFGIALCVIGVLVRFEASSGASELEYLVIAGTPWLLILVGLLCFVLAGIWLSKPKPRKSP